MSPDIALGLALLGLTAVLVVTLAVVDELERHRRYLRRIRAERDRARRRHPSSAAERDRIARTFLRGEWR